MRAGSTPPGKPAIPLLDMSQVSRRLDDSTRPNKKLKQTPRLINRVVKANRGALKRAKPLTRRSKTRPIRTLQRTKSLSQMQKTLTGKVGQLFRSLSFSNLRDALGTPTQEEVRADALQVLSDTKDSLKDLPPELARTSYAESQQTVQQLKAQIDALSNLPKGIKGTAKAMRDRVGSLNRLMRAKNQALAKLDMQTSQGKGQAAKIDAQFKQSVEKLGFKVTDNLEKLAKTRGGRSLLLVGVRLKRRASKELKGLKAELDEAQKKMGRFYLKMLPSPAGALKALGFTQDSQGRVCVPLNGEAHPIDTTPQKLWQVLVDKGPSKPMRFALGDGKEQLVIARGKDGPQVLMVDEYITVGGAGEIWKAKNILTDEACVVKQSVRDPNGLRKEYANRQAMADGKAVSGLQRPHEALLDFGEHTMLITHLYRGDLSALLIEDKNPPPLSVAQKLEFAVDIFSGTQAVQSAGFYHLDIKPVNIFVDEHGVDVADFDGCKQLTPALLDDPDFSGLEGLIEASPDSVPLFEFMMMDQLRQAMAQRREQFREQFETPEAQLEQDAILQEMWTAFESLVTQVHTWSASSAALDVLRQKLTDPKFTDDQAVHYYSKQDEIETVRQQIAKIEDPAERKAMETALSVIEKGLQPFPHAPDPDAEFNPGDYRKNFRAKLSTSKDEYSAEAMDSVLAPLQTSYRPSTESCLKELQQALSLI